jgi:hypothetical protein
MDILMDKMKLAASMISPKRCGGLGCGTCAKCGEKKFTYEKFVKRAKVDGKYQIVEDRRDTWICVECRVAKGEYKRCCDECGELKPSQHAPFIRWHWWCSDCTTSEREAWMRFHEKTR